MRKAACSWARADDALGLLLGLLDDPLALGVDPLRRADLLGDGHPQLIDQAERRILVDDHIRRERQLLAVGDERLEALDEEDDVDGRGPPAAWIMARAGSVSDGASRPAQGLSRGVRHHR